MFETKDLTIGNDTYTLKKFPTIRGMQIRKDLFEIHQSGGGVPPVDFQVEVICQGATVNSIQIDKKKFETHFRGKFDVMDELFNAILDFNFNTSGDEGNVQDATAE